MRRLTFALILGLLSRVAYAQMPALASTNAKLDSLAKLSQRFINNNQPDSLYALMGKAFKQQISLDKMKEVTAQVAGQLGKWTGLELQSVTEGVARYKAIFAGAPLDFYISQDKQGKIETFLFKPL